MVLFLALATRAGAPIDSFRVQAVVSSVVSLLVMCLTHPVEDGVHESEVLCRKLASRCGQGGRHASLQTRYAQSFGGLLHPTVEIFPGQPRMFVSIYVSYLSCDW